MGKIDNLMVRDRFTNIIYWSILPIDFFVCGYCNFLFLNLLINMLKLLNAIFLIF